ncbi:MAG: glycosyltransferase family 2 protein [Chloroflexota bacterium]
MAIKISVVIPVWNGESVILQCLDALYKHTHPADTLPNYQLLEVICVDNASQDKSAALIQEHYPQAHLISQKVNLGFAGGVNAGMAAAQGDLFVLLNQDCLIDPYVFANLCDGLAQMPQAGIAGCTLFHDDGSVNHAGAIIMHPLAYGQHLTEISTNGSTDGLDTAKLTEVPYLADYVTGALFAIRRRTWDTIGPFDEGFYPRDHEESDYCYRARAHGIEIIYVPNASGHHLFSSDEWRSEPERYTANQHQSRYRFVIKHFSPSELTAFFVAEREALQTEVYTGQLTGRVVAARHTLRHLDEIFDRRVQDRPVDAQSAFSDAVKREIDVGFTAILRDSFARAKKVTGEWTLNHPPKLSPLPSIEVDTDAFTMPPPPIFDQFPKLDFEKLRQEEHELLEKIFFQQHKPTSTAGKIWRFGVLRLLSFVSGREHRLLATLNTIHVWRLDALEQYFADFTEQLKAYQKVEAQWRQYIERQEVLLQYIEHLEKQTTALHDEIAQNRHQQIQSLDQIRILDSLVDFDYR